MHTTVECLRKAAAASLVAASAAFSAAPVHQVTPIPAGPTMRAVSYRGYQFRVPRSWTIVDLADNPRACVRFDRHVLYLGRPGADEDCPANIVGRTEALLVQPGAGRPAIPGAVADGEAHEVDISAARIAATATYGTDVSVVRRLLVDAGLPAGGSGSLHAVAADERSLGEPPDTALRDATDFRGKGFDACTAPSAATMHTWTGASPYHAVGIYIGGSERACSQPNLTTSWVRNQYDAGWRFLPIYVGEQASSISAPTSEGAAAAADAVARACQLGFGPGATLYFDIEAYDADDSSNVLAFETAWTRALHAKGYRSGFYSSSDSGIHDLADRYSDPVYEMPDVVFDALWNGIADTNDATVPAADWRDHRRVHQFSGGVSETWGGVRQTIDRDYLDVRLSDHSRE